MSVVVTVLVAVALGVVVTLLLTRLRRPPRRPEGPTPEGVDGILLAYRDGRYRAVIQAAPTVLAGLGRGPETAEWRARVELVWGHALFQEDRFAESIRHLEGGLDGGEAVPGEARFRHCLGYAYQRCDRPEDARRVYEELLADPDLDPTVREGVRKHLGQLEGPIG